MLYHRLPGENFDLSKWQLQLPIKDGDSIVIISPMEIDDYESSVFYTETDGSMAFKCPTNGATTKNSKYPRVELRETDEWNLLVGIHMLIAKVKITKVAKGKGVIFSQIHGDNPNLNPQIVKLYYDTKGNVYVEYKNDRQPSASELKVNLGQYKIGDMLSYTILVDNGKVTIFINGIKKSITFTNEYWKKQKVYYKLGSYIQDNEGDDYATVQCYDLNLHHI